MSNRQEVILSAAGNSRWIPLDWARPNAKVALIARISSGASLTYQVQHTQDGARVPERLVTISRTTTTATVTDTAHKLTTGDSVIIRGSGSTNLDSEAGVDITVSDANTYTYTVANSGATAASAFLRQMRVQPHETMTAQTGNDDANYEFVPVACRLRVTTYASGSVGLTVLEGN